MKKNFTSLLTACLLIHLFSMHHLFSQSGVIDRIAAVVDDEIILLSEVQSYAYFEAMNQKIDSEKNPEAYREIQVRVLDGLINQKILIAQAIFDSVTVEESQVEQALENQIQERIKQAGGEQALESYLGKSIKEIRKLYRQDVRKQLLAQKIQNSRFGNIKVSRSEIEKYFEAHKDSFPEIGESISFSHILMEIKPGEEAFEEARKQAQAVLDSIRKGADFAEMARRYSTDPGSARKGGELGWFNRSDFVKEYADAVGKLEVGEISGLVKTQFGWHIVQLQDKAGEKIKTRHILFGVATTNQDKTRAKETLMRIRKDILDGKLNFEEAVLRFSDDPTKKGNMGNLGWIEVASLNERGQAFLRAAKELKKGEISEPFEGEFGFHIIRLNDRRDKRRVTLKDDWQTIEAIALQAKQSEEMNKWLKQIRSRFYVDIRVTF